MGSAMLAAPGASLSAAAAQPKQKSESPLDAVLREMASSRPATLAELGRLPGVGARNLAECLALQAKAADRYDPAMARLIDNLELLSRGQMPALKRICGVDDEDLADMVRELRAYDPKPGCRYSNEGSDSVTPDVFVRRTAQGYAVELNGATLPRLLVNRRYYQELRSGPQDKASKAWLSECLTTANWLVKALDQRARTIVKVVSEIVNRPGAQPTPHALGPAGSGDVGQVRRLHCWLAPPPQDHRMIFVPFAVLYMRQPVSLNFLWAGLCMVGAVYFVFRA